MNQKLTPEQAKALLDSLFSMPDAQAKPKVKAPAKPKAEKVIANAVFRTPHNFKPVLQIIEIVRQECECGSVHEFIRGRRVRLEDSNPKNKNNTAVEVQCIVPSAYALPRRIDETIEITNVCPSCARSAYAIDDFLAGTLTSTQGELFHG